MRKILLCLAFVGCNSGECPGVDNCIEIGYLPVEGEACRSGVCDWSEPFDDTCLLSAFAFCFCQEKAGNGVCTDRGRGDLYVACHVDQDAVSLCRAEVSEDGTPDCAAMEACK